MPPVRRPVLFELLWLRQHCRGAHVAICAESRHQTASLAAPRGSWLIGLIGLIRQSQPRATALPRCPRRNLRREPTPNSVSRRTKRLLAYRAYRAYRAYSPVAAKVPRTTDRLPTPLSAPGGVQRGRPAPSGDGSNVAVTTCPRVLPARGGRPAPSGDGSNVAVTTWQRHLAALVSFSAVRQPFFCLLR